MSVLTDFSFIDLFAGIGGMRLAFDALGGACVFASECDQFARRTYARNFDEDEDNTDRFAGDITEISPARVPDHDVLLAGFPCQPFSLAGVSKKNSLGRPHGFACETQGTLFFNIAEILRSKRPRAFLLENVKHLTTHDRGRTFRIIMQTLRDDLQYEVAVRVIDARAFVPQHRERVYLVGFRDTTAFDFDAMRLPDASAGPRLRSLLHPEDGTEKAEPPYTIGELADVARKYVLTPALWTYLQGYAEKHKRKGNGFGFSLVGPEDVTRTLSARYHKDGSEVLVKTNHGQPRRLTPRECSRLMGFDSYREHGFAIPVSDTQAYRQFGNAVVPQVVQAIGAHMLRYVLDPAAPAVLRSEGQLPLAVRG